MRATASNDGHVTRVTISYNDTTPGAHAVPGVFFVPSVRRGAEGHRQAGKQACRHTAAQPLYLSLLTYCSRTAHALRLVTLSCTCNSAQSRTPVKQQSQ